VIELSYLELYLLAGMVMFVTVRSVSSHYHDIIPRKKRCSFFAKIIYTFVGFMIWPIILLVIGFFDYKTLEGKP